MLTMWAFGGPACNVEEVPACITDGFLSKILLELKCNTKDHTNHHSYRPVCLITDTCWSLQSQCELVP